MANYNEQTKEELLELARERDLEGRSSMNKEELVAALEKSDSDGQAPQGDEGELRNPADTGDTPEEVEPTLPEAVEGEEREEAAKEHAAVTHHTEASDPEEVAGQLSSQGQAALTEMGPDSAAAMEADLALDASGPLHLESPSERVMTGALNEEHAKEQAELIGELPEDYVGDIREDGTLVNAREARKDSGPNGEVLQTDVIDFPPPLQPAEDREADEVTRDERGTGTFAQVRAAEQAFPDEGPTVAAPRLYEQRGQLYTDGISGQADHNTAMAYRMPDVRGGVFGLRDEGPMKDEVEAMEKDRTGDE